MKTKTINIVTLGCSKNTVDSEFLGYQLKQNNFDILFDAEVDTDIVIINTCGFILDAKEESIDMILNFVEIKNQRRVKKLIVFGCLVELFKEQLQEEISEVDAYFGANNLYDIVRFVKSESCLTINNKRLQSTPKHYSFLKISEGCDRTCSFCIIPKIRGKHHSKSIENLLEEAHYLAANGTKELLLIAQDLTYYGYDLYGKNKLTELVDKLSTIKGIEWLRLHYAYPTGFPFELIDLMNERKNICNYIDIPFQHISNRVLKNMKRGYTQDTVKKIIADFREKIPNVAIRTTFIVGHPGETYHDFKKLRQFIEDVKFDRLGIFSYSDEEGTKAFLAEKKVSKQIIKKRHEEIMQLQQEISYNLNQQKIGKTYKTIIDRREGEHYIGRTYADSPDVDNNVLIKSAKNSLQIGEFYTIKITAADNFDIWGEV